MKIRRSLSLALVGAALTTAVAVPAASAATPVDAPAGSVLDLLEADGTAFDSNWYDFDILEAAARVVVSAPDKGSSTVLALADPTAKLTVLAPNDRAFQVLARSLTGKWYWSEEAVLGAIAGAITNGLGADLEDTLEAVLLYHVIGAKVTFADVKALSGKSVATVGGGTIGIKYYPWLNLLTLRDKDGDAVNPWVINSKRNIAVGTNSIVHGIALVLRPIDLP
ncbi:MAG TPA: fasciclin domain-containing protein [Candidatus Limnocylindrales bacterium]|nr:fasciclin domain-containing protein [Candidatus Limnocylindrales bacterium]